MATWQLTSGLQTLRAQVNARWPNRDHASDGTIGDLAHQGETSGHNPDDTTGSRPEYDDHDGKAEVRAWDMDVDLGEPGTTAQMLVDHLRALPGLASVIRYMIYNRREYHVADGFAPKPYTGASAHTEHIHFSGARSQAADQDTSFDYRLEEVGVMPLTADDLSKVQAASYAAVSDFFWGANHAAREDDSYKSADDGTQRRWRNARDVVRAVTGGPVDQGAILAAVTTRADVDEQVLAAALIPGLTAAILGHLPDGSLTEAQVEDAVRNVLRSGVGA